MPNLATRLEAKWLLEPMYKAKKADLTSKVSQNSSKPVPQLQSQELANRAKYPNDKLPV